MPATVETRASGSAGMVPEIVLPAQFFPNVRFDSMLRPEKRLMLAVLEEAAGTYQRYAAATGRGGRRLFREAEVWFASEDVGWPFSFVNVCHTLGLDVSYLRAGLERWRDAQRTRALAGGRTPRFPFRRVNGSRTRATGRAIGLAQLL